MQGLLTRRSVRRKYIFESVRGFFVVLWTMGRIAFKRMGREWRLLSILLFAVCLITGFFALGPLYIRTVTEVDLRYALNNASPAEKRITIISNEQLEAADQDFIEDEIGAIATHVERFKRATYSPPQVTVEQGSDSFTTTAVCGFDFSLGQNVFLTGTGSTGHCYQPYAFDNLAEKVRVVEGRLPQRGPTPEMVDPTGLTDAQQQELQIGIYSRAQVEAVVTATVAELGELEIGSRFYVGSFAPGNTGVSIVKIVGIVEPLDPTDTFWSGNTMFLEGASVEINNLGQLRYDHGLAFHPDAYEDWISPVLPNGVNTNYLWVIDTDPERIDSTNAESYRDRLVTLGPALSVQERAVSVTSGLVGVLAGYQNRVGEAQGPIILLSGAVLILMLYHLITTVSLVLQEQGREWSTITSRGGSTLQLFTLQAVTVFILVLIAGVAGPFLSRLFMEFLELNGPLADTLAGVDVGTVAIPPISIALSAGAAAASFLVLSLPSIAAARESLLRLKQATSRPPTMPAWTRFFLDFVFIIVGILLLLRLYLTVSGDRSLGDLLSDLFSDPAGVIRFIADNASAEGGLSDPFNLIAPALILTGFALLWLRVFPLLMKVISYYTSRNHKLATPLAVWNVERDPGHYAQLVLLLIGTLALGTASLGLQKTRDVGGWQAALEETGGAVRLDIDPQIGRAIDFDWMRLDGVTHAVPILQAQGQPSRSTRGDVTIIGIDMDAFLEAFPELASDYERLPDVPFTLSGVALPADAAQLQVQVWSSSEVRVLPSVRDETDPTVPPTVIVNAYVQDALGVPYRIQLTQNVINADVSGQQTGNTLPPTPTDQWLTFSGQLPANAVLPLRLWQVGLKSTLLERSFTHTVYLDYWQTLDENGTAAVIDSQETSALWSQAVSTMPNPADWMATNSNSNLTVDNFALVDTMPDGQSVYDGQNALAFAYTRRNRPSDNEPSLSFSSSTFPRLPAIISDEFTQIDTRANAPDLEVGSFFEFGVNFPTGTVNVGIEVMSVADVFPTLDEDNPNQRFFVILPYDAAQVLLNQPLVGQSSRANIADANQVWLQLDERQPSDTLEAEIEQLPMVTSVSFAWDRFSAILREPLPSGVAGMLFAGFWVSFILSLLDFAFYIVVTAKQRSFTFGVLRSLGWNANNIWQMLLIEQITLVIPAIIIGSLLGAGLAYLLLPFLSLVGGATLQIPIVSVLLLILTLVIGFVILLVFTAMWLRQMSVNQVLRLGEE